MKYKFSIVLCAVALLWGACEKKTSQTEESENTAWIEISKAQFKSEKMEMATLFSMPFADKLHFTGTVTASPNGLAYVSAPVAGIIKNIRCTVGCAVKKGDVLLDISGYAIIDLQQEYAESVASLQRLKMDYDRIKGLYDEKIGAKKDFILAENAYMVELAKNNALKIKIESAGLNPTQIAQGAFYDSYPLKAPIDGYITQLDAVNGRFVEPQAVLSEIVDQDGLRLSIPIFGVDIAKVFVGQQVDCYLGDEGAPRFKAVISSIGKSVDKTTKAVTCFAEIGNKANTVHNQFVEGDIVLRADSSIAVPTSALLSAEKDRFVLLLQKETDEAYFFKKTRVNTGRENSIYTELKGQTAGIEKILTKGVYHISVE